LNAGETLLLLTAVVFCIAFVLRLLALLRVWTISTKSLETVTKLSFALLTAALLYMLYLLGSSDMSYLYVWSNTSVDLDFPFKISALWAGSQGSFLIMTWFMSLGLIAELRFEKKRGMDERFQSISQTSMLGVIALFMLVLLTTGVFAPTVADPINDGWRLTLFGQGLGLKVILQTWEMALHPFIIFAGYAFCLVTFAASLAGSLTKDERWSFFSLFWARLAWIFVTLGIGIGAIWAYYVIGWGGYWSWDPLETSALLLWLMLTLFLHTQLRLARDREYVSLSPLLGMLVFEMALFATFVTRAGGLWASSVHSYGAVTATAATNRLWELLNRSPAVLGIFLLMILVLFITSYIGYRNRSINRKEEKVTRPFKINDSISMLIAVILFSATILIMLLILLKNVDMTFLTNYDEFNQKMAFLFIAVIISLTICLSWKRIGSRNALILGIVMIALTLASGLIGASIGSDILFSLSLPAFLAGVLAALYRVVKSYTKGSWRKTMRNLGPQLVHLGIALLLIGYVFSSFMQVYPATGPYNQLSVGGELTAGDYSIRLVSLRINDLPSSSGGQFNQSRTAVLEISQSGKIIQSGVELTNLYLADGSNASKIESSVHIYKTETEDLYLSFEWGNATSALLQMKVVPMINALWSGMGLLIVGLSIRFLVWPNVPSREGRMESLD
jgi:cytochrome c-type biogenesis protein CcmF